MKSWQRNLVAFCAAYCAVQCSDAFNEKVVQAKVGCFHHPEDESNIYAFEEKDIFEERNISLADYEGQYYDLNALQSSYSNFTILGFPCNQFGQQEPGYNVNEILNGIKFVRPGHDFEPNFLLFKKVEVNGINEHPLFAYLKSACPPTRNYFVESGKLFYEPMKVNDIRWNFEKFLISKTGKPYMRYDPHTLPRDIASDINFLLMQDF